MNKTVDRIIAMMRATGVSYRVAKAQVQAEADAEEVFAAHVPALVEDRLLAAQRTDEALARRAGRSKFEGDR